MAPNELEHQALIDDLVSQLRAVNGVHAIVLGGSRARGTHTPASDIDLGIYYDAKAPFDLPALAAVATRVDDTHRADLVTPIGGWGSRINGGGWLTIQGIPVDFIYRDLTQVSRVIDECLAGHVEMAYQPGHPHGFVSSTYMAEIAVCRPLWQSNNEITNFQALTRPYPPALQRALVGMFSWEISFALDIAKKGIARADVVYVAGCAFRAVMCMCQVLFALNQQYWLNEKGAVAQIETFAIRPQDWRARIDEAFQHLADNSRLAQGIHLLAGLAQEVEQLSASV